MTLQTLPPAEWRRDAWGKERHALYLGKLYVGSIMYYQGSEMNGGDWRGWFMSDDDGDSTGWFVTDYEARASVEAALATALNGAVGEAADK